MLNEKPSFVIDTIYAWLLDNRQDAIEISKEQTQAAIDLATQQLGYGEPFNAEQKVMNEMLFEKKADALTCQTAWGFYHDYTNADTESARAA